MITEFRVYWRLRPYIKQLKGELTMKFSSQMILQILGTVAQGLNAIGGLTPPKYVPLVAATLAIIQGIAGLVGHFSNPDGTPASEPYVKK